MTPQLISFLAAERHFETAAAQILRDGGLKVVSPFVPMNADGTPQELPDDCAWPVFELGDVDDGRRVFRDNPAWQGGTSSMPAGFEGVLEIHHRVRVTDRLTQAGAGIPECYARLCDQRGLIRALFLEDENPFADLLPDFDILAIRIIQPDRNVQIVKQANQAVERFRITYAPRASVTSA